MSLTLRKAAGFRVARGPVVLQRPVLTDTSIFTGDYGGFLARLDRQSGRQVWRKRRSGSIRSAHGNRIVVYSGDERETQMWDEGGKVLWRRQGNLGGHGEHVYLNEAGQLQLIEVMTGKTVNEFECPPGVPSLTHDGVLLLRNPEGGADPIHAIDLANRRVLWRKDLVADISSRLQAPCSSGLAFNASLPSQFVAKSVEHLVGVSLADGRLLWGREALMPHHAPMAVGGQLYVWSAPSAPTATRVTLDLHSGQVTRERSGPAVSENRLVIVNEATGQIVVDRPLGSYGAAFKRVQEAFGGTICKHHVVFTSRSGLIAAFRLSDGELAWWGEHRDQLFSPVFEGDRLYVPCADGTLVVFEAEGDEL